jgi:glutamate N-acetyltransferase / amino-acid N-acetyltransferase
MKIKNATKDLDHKSNDKLFLKSKSTFAPKHFKDLTPKGFKIFTFHSGFKKKNDDLLFIIFDKTIKVASKYSLTATPSAPIIWDKINNNGLCKALIVNSGNANAFTGSQGIKNIDKYTAKLAKYLSCSINDILVSSTGVIGEQLNQNLICKKISLLNVAKEKKLIDAARSILTTDTFLKTSVYNLKIDSQNIKLYGFAKGSGMINPNMGTMLAYIFIDCEIPSDKLKKLLSDNLQDTFNSISVDSDTSTSDTLLLFSNPLKKINIKRNYKKISNCLNKVMKELSMKIITDGEGIKKLIKVSVIKAKNKIQAKKIAFSIANSPLVKTAIAGEDANWGRVVMAIGKTQEKINQEKIMIKFGNNLLGNKGKKNSKINIPKVDKYMKNKIIEIEVSLGLGSVSSVVYGNDLNSQYIKINADYRS